MWKCFNTLISFVLLFFICLLELNKKHAIIFILFDFFNYYHFLMACGKLGNTEKTTYFHQKSDKDSTKPFLDEVKICSYFDNEH